MWFYDFVFDQTEDGRRHKWLPICDGFTRESVALEVERKMEAEDVVRALERAVEERGAPACIRSDNGPEFVAKAVRDELLNIECFGALAEAKVLGKEYRHGYNDQRPHSSLD